jgi:DNA-binding HxlR family transcriptional regulator
MQPFLVLPRKRQSRADYRSTCPISSALDLVGDRWTLLVVRDLFFAGARRFGDFLKSTEVFPTNLLADRLRRLEEIGVLRKTPYQKRPVRYEYHLTTMGKELLPVLTELSRWSLRHLPHTVKPPPEAFARVQSRRT